MGYKLDVAPQMEILCIKEKNTIFTFQKVKLNLHG